MTDPDAILDRAMSLLVAGEFGPALLLLLPARTANPAHATIAWRTADALHMAGRLDEAVAEYDAAIKLSAELASYGLGRALLAQGAFGASSKALRRAIDIRPDAETRHAFGTALFELGQVDAAIAQFQQVRCSADPTLAGLAHRSLACIVPGADAADHAMVLAARRGWASQVDHPPTLCRRPIGRGKARVGYMSAFFGARNWMKPVWGVINHHDRSRFEVHMFSDGVQPSQESGYRDHAADYVHAVGNLDHAQLAAVIAEAEIDVLIDLNGYSVQDRLAVVMSRPAPVVIGWFNMFATTGIDAFDWLVGDATVIRPGEERFYSERIHRVPGSYLAFEVSYPTPPIGPPPCHGRDGRITFGCLGSQYKLTDAVLAAWGAILHATPQADLFIKNAALSDASTRRDMLDRLAREGVEAGRVHLDGRAEHSEFLRAYDRIDIALDTFPYNGGTTTTEALWQGVPVLTFDGDRWASRTSASLLLAAGLDTWVLPDRDAYCRRAVALASDPATPAMLATLRCGMRDRLRASAACDTVGLCRALEQFYLSCIVSAGEAPV